MNGMRSGAFAALALFTVVFMAACGGGAGGSTPGSGGSANSAVGEIVGFGSVIVNGIEFSRKAGLADDRVRLGFDNISGAGEGRLKVGMMVRIKGTFDSATGRGEYEAIEFQPELRGRLDSVNEVADTVTIMGRTVQIEPGSQFDNLRDLSELTADVAGGDRPELEISGNLDDRGVLHATRVAKAAQNFADNGPVEIKGAIASVDTGTFTIGGVTVSTTGAIFANMTAADIASGLLVEVKGAFDTTTNTIRSARIERKRAVEAEVDDRVLVKGVAAGAIGDNSFALNGPNGAITVRTAGATFSRNGVVATSAIVTAGTRLQVEGSLDATGAILATKVAVEIEKTVKLRGGLSAKDSAAGTLAVNAVTATVVAGTRFIDSSSARLSPFTLADLSVGDNVEVAGFVNAAGEVVATQVQRFSLPVSRTFVQGPVSAATAGNVSILGITVTVGVGTRYQRPDKTPFPGGEVAFISAIEPGVTVVKASGTFAAPGSIDARAGEVQFERLP